MAKGNCGNWCKEVHRTCAVCDNIIHRGEPSELIKHIKYLWKSDIHSKCRLDIPDNAL